MKIGILVCAHNAFWRTGLQSQLGKIGGIDVVGEASSAAEAEALAERLAPDVVLTNIDLADDVEGGRWSWLPKIRRDRARPTILLLADRTDRRLIGGLRAGIAGVITDDCTAEELRRAVLAVHEGHRYLQPCLVDPVLAFLRDAPADADHDVVRQLTARERDILDLVAEGLSNREIGARLFLSETTVKHHVSHLLRKLGNRDRLQLAVFAHRNGLVARRSAS
ncbi:response regulator transcription factor [Saccharopolyspora sp. NPDC003752]